MPLRGATAHGWRAVRSSKRLLAIVCLTDFFVCLPLAAYVASEVHTAASHRQDALGLAQHYDADFIADLRRGHFDADVTVLAWAGIVAYFLLRPLIVGGFVGIAATGRRLHMAQFLREGGAVYWKYLRLSLLGLGACYLLSIGARPLLEAVTEWSSSSSEPVAIRYKDGAQFAAFGAFCVVQIVLEYARVGIRLRRKPGVFVELGRSALFVLQHPIWTISLFAFSLAAEAALVFAASWAIQLSDGGYLTTSAIVLVLGQVLVTSREAVRLFHVAAAWHVRASEAGDERQEPEVIEPEPQGQDVLRAPLPWNVR